MGEGVRLKSEILSQNLIQQQSNPPQHPQQRMETEKLLKETPSNNNIEYNGTLRPDCFRLHFIK